MIQIVGRLDDLDAVDLVDVGAARVAEDDLVARHELVDVPEDLMLAHAVAADHDVADLRPGAPSPASDRDRGRAW